MAHRVHANQDAEAKMMEMRTIEGRLEALGKHKELVTSRLTEIENTINGMDEIANAKSDVIFHLGGEAFVPARPNNDGKVVVMIGADVAVEKTPEEAKVLLETRKKEANEAMKHVDSEIKSLTKKLESMIPDM